MSQLPTIGHLIDGKLTDGNANARSQSVYNPATGKAEKRLLLADKTTVEQAIASAQAAFPAWRNTPPLKRARIMGNLKVLLEKHSEEICALITAEHGKVLSDAAGELQRGIENVEYASYAPELLKGERATPQSDVYSLGTTLYTLCAGRAAFAADTDASPAAVLVRIISEEAPPLPPSVPPALAEVIARRHLDELGIIGDVHSAGTAAVDGAPATDGAVATARFMPGSWVDPGSAAVRSDRYTATALPIVAMPTSTITGITHRGVVSRTMVRTSGGAAASAAAPAHKPRRVGCAT